MTPKGPYLFHILTTATIALAWRLSKHPGSNGTATFDEQQNSNFTQLTKKYGYASTEHTVVTQDGYILKIFRMEGRSCREKKTPVILSHGLLQSSDVWLDAGPEAGLAFLLADACYDLWISNVRGNYYGRKHTHLDPEDSKFWQFSVDEIGIYDVPAVIVNVTISLAPATRQVNTKSVPYRTTALLFERFSGLLSRLGYEEVFAKGTMADGFLNSICSVPIVSTFFCDLTSFVDSGHPGSMSNGTKRALYKHFPAGTSLKNMVRYSQSMRSKEFVKFDYGETKNLKIYGARKPPVYNLGAVTVPVVIIYGKNDHLVDAEDIRWLVKKLPNVVASVQVADPLWNHFDMTYSKFSSKMVFLKVNKYLKQYS